MTNIVSIQEIHQKQLNELSEIINRDIFIAINDIALKTRNTAIKFDLTAIDFAGLIGGGIACYFVHQIISEQILSTDFDDYVQYCKKLNEPLVKGLDMYINSFVDEILRIKSKS